MYPQASKCATSLKILLHFRSYTCDCFFRILGSIKMKSPIMAHISNSSLAHLLRLETNSSPLYGIKYLPRSIHKSRTKFYFQKGKCPLRGNHFHIVGGTSLQKVLTNGRATIGPYCSNLIPK